VGCEIEKRPEAQLQRDLRRMSTRPPVRMAATGAVMGGAGAGLIAVGADLSWMALVPFYFLAGLGALLVVVGGLTWWARKRRQDREGLPPARLLPP
jgi:hypothetical protein